MAVLVQVVLINLVVSIDNVGVIALATKDLPHDQALTARKVGTALSILLKAFFIVIAGYLFSIPWLHIRIVGGIMLFYVTWSMIAGHGAHAPDDCRGGGPRKDRFSTAILAIVAADISMSMDNVIAILGVVSTDGTLQGAGDYLLVFAGLLISVPVLLLCSDTIAGLMNRYHALVYVCAGYLVYTAVNMIFEDETIVLFFEHINFSFTTQAAVLCGILLAMYGLAAELKPEWMKRNRQLQLPVYCAFVLYFLVAVGVISYLSTNPYVEGFQLSVEGLYHFTPSGVNAVYIVRTAYEIFALGALVFAEINCSRYCHESYGVRLCCNLLQMMVIIALALIVTTTGLTVTFGAGRMNPGEYILTLLIHTIPLYLYSAVYCLLSVFTQNKVKLALAGLTYLMLEPMLGFWFMVHGWDFCAGLTPSYHNFKVFMRVPMSLGTLVQTVLPVGIFILFSYYAGSNYRRES